MAFDINKYPLAVSAIDEIESLHKAAGKDFDRNRLTERMDRQWELLDGYTDGSAKEKESLITAAILIMGGPDTVHSRDISGYAEKFNGQVASFVQEIHDIVDEGFGTKASKGILQVIAAHQLGVYEYYMGFIKTDPDFYNLNSAEPRNAQFAKSLQDDAWNEARFAAPYPKGLDLGAPRLKQLIQDETNAFYAEFNKLNNIGSTSAAPAAKDAPKP